MQLNSVDFYGLKISVFTRQELEDYLFSCIKEHSKKICYGYSFGYLPKFKNEPKLYEYANAYDVMVTDGRQFYLFAQFMGMKLKYDISIPYLSKMAMKIADENKFSMLIIGSDEETNSAATIKIRKEYPNAIVYDGITGGDFSEVEQAKAVDIINFYSPDILFIGASSPKKEVFASKWKNKLDTKLIIPFGGMIDGLAGKVRLTPPLLKKLGLATLIRVIQEPRRLLWLNIWVTYETFFKVIPKILWEVKIKKNINFFIPSIYNIKKK